MAGAPPTGASAAPGRDRAVTVAGDETGLHVLVADSGQNGATYRWRTAATLAENGLDTDLWIGNACVTGDGDRAVVVYAPRAFVDDVDLFDGGGFAAVVDLDRAVVHHLDVRVSLAYFDPGCGPGSAAVLSRLDTGGARATTRLYVVDTRSGRIEHTIRANGQLTSAVPFGSTVAAAGGAGVVRVDNHGRARSLAATKGVPFRLVPDAQGGLGFLVARGERSDVMRVAGGRTERLASGALPDVDLRAGLDGQVFVTGKVRGAFRLPGWQYVDVPAGTSLSGNGRLAVLSSTTYKEAITGSDSEPADGRPDRIYLSTRPVGGKDTTIRQEAVVPAGRPSTPTARSSNGPVSGLALAEPLADDPATTPWDPDRVCAIPRNDPRLMTVQNTAPQAAWAAELAVRGALTITRPTDWNRSGLVSWTPQGMFPPNALAGGGRVPAQTLFGVLAQESNMWQASPHAADGIAGNFNQGGFYGSYGVVDKVEWSKADCGYGAAQVTTGMRIGDPRYTRDQQVAITVDYASNIAAGLQILQAKWNTVRGMNLVMNDGDPRYLENWWGALWAYNSGINPQASTGNTSGCTPGPGCTDADGNWGLGWANNPVNPNYPPNRRMFLQATYDDAKTPGNWSYPERVMGWTATPLLRYNFASKQWERSYGAGTWPSTPPLAQPSRTQFCSAENSCDPAQAMPCGRADLHCWWHVPARWIIDCTQRCGQERLAYSTSAPEPTRPPPYQPRCDRTGLPPAALVIDDRPVTEPSIAPCPKGFFSNAGTFTLTFPTAATSPPTWPAKVDFHHGGTGFAGHFWFAHTRKSDRPNLAVTGRWQLSSPINAWGRVLVHLPEHGAHTAQAHYRIYTAAGVQDRFIPTRYWPNDAWVNLGVFDFTSGTPAVELTSVTRDGTGELDVAYDAVAFVPLAAKPEHFIVVMGDSYTSGEGAEGYDPVSDNNGNDPALRNACHRSKDAWGRLLTLPDSTASLGARAAALDSSLDFQFIACANARTHHVLPYGTINGLGQSSADNFHEVPQISSGFLDANTTLVMLTIGGNDAGFSEVLRDCVLGTCAFDPDTERQYTTRIRGPVRTSIEQTLLWIRQAAPNARVVLVGYPLLFSDNHDDCTDLISDPEAAVMNRLGTVLAEQMAQAVSNVGGAGMRFHFSDPLPAFTGRGACTPGALLNGPIMIGDPDPGDTDGLPRAGSFHPNAGGTHAYASTLQNTLAQIGYRN
ncbi:SGNH/GDSL hydrolase family protein [Flindersiella endophytica]